MSEPVPHKHGDDEHSHGGGGHTHIHQGDTSKKWTGPTTAKTSKK